MVPVVALTAAWVALRLWLDIPPRGVVTMGRLFGMAVSAAAIPFGVALGVFRLMRWERAAGLRWASCAVWLAPVMVLLGVRSVWVVAPGMVLLVSLVAAVRRYRGEQDEAAGEPVRAEPFGLIEAEGWHARFAGALVTAVMAELAVLAPMTGRARLGLVLGTAALVVITWRLAGVMRERATWRRPALTVGIAFLVMWMALFPFIRLPRGRMGSGGAQWLVAAVLALVRPPVVGPTGEGKAERRARSQDEWMGEDYPGVIVYPEMEVHTVLVAPPRVMARGVMAPRAAAEQSIPFFGVYWFYRFPQEKPPGNSIVMRSDPAKRGFFTLDGTPLNMEARQNLGVEVTLAGCREIAMDVRSTERRRVWLELILVDTQSKGEPKEPLGRQLLPGETTAARLRWVVPRQTDLRRFDEFRVRFHRQFGFGTKSAKVAIVRFVMAG